MMSKFSSSICPIFSSSVIFASVFSTFFSSAASRGMAGRCAHARTTLPTSNIVKKLFFILFVFIDFSYII